MTDTKQFKLCDVLTITANRLLSERGMDGLYDILGWLTNDTIYGHQAGRAMQECRPWLLRWFPELAQLNEPELHVPLDAELDAGRNWQLAARDWIAAMSARFSLPDAYDVPRIPRDDHEYKDPIEELVELVGPDRVIGFRA